MCTAGNGKLEKYGWGYEKPFIKEYRPRKRILKIGGISGHI